MRDRTAVLCTTLALLVMSGSHAWGEERTNDGTGGTQAVCRHPSPIHLRPTSDSRQLDLCSQGETMTTHCYVDNGADLWLRVSPVAEVLGYINLDNVEVKNWNQLSRCAR
ncbi:hypothetical protein SAMN04487819_101478 [Actinopolyspora alba]|uniref:SH3 domain-containing protein n=1 Tax=Actinopolyspora alba TaxID=673379 RepID=A0A1I1U2Q3_9ACTN|nr:hypothetical protein SAMN04487819_101478 [Actinopolyspora alba]